MLLLFLDIDGVLNHGYDPSRVTIHPTTGWGGQHPTDYNEGFNYHVESCVLALNAITRATGAKIVISSSWRHAHTLDELRCILHDQFGVEGDIIAVTPDDVLDAEGFDAARICEIRAFLDRFEEQVLGFAILDDLDITLDINNERSRDHELEARFVRTVTEVGLTTDLAQRAEQLLALPRVGAS
jgi:hypothetical protein